MQMNRVSNSLILVGLLIVCSPLGAVTVIVDDFENVAWGEKWVTGPFTLGATPEIRKVGNAHGGSFAAAISVGTGTIVVQHEVGKDFVGNGEKFRLPLPGKPTRLGIWCRGNGTPVEVKAALVDDAGKSTELNLGTITRQEWTFLAKPVPASLAFPIRLHHLTLRYADEQARTAGPVLIDDLTVETSSEDKPLFMVFEQSDRETPLVPNRTFYARARLQNISSRPLDLNASLELQDRRDARNAVAKKGHVVMRDEQDLSLQPGEERVLLFAMNSAPAVLNAVLEVCREDTLLADSDLELRIFPDRRKPAEKIRHFLAADRDFLFIQSDFTPAVLCRSQGPELYCFRNLPEGQTLPQYVAYAGASGLRVARLTEEPIPLDMAESWLVVWFGEHESMQGRRLLEEPFDVPFLISLQRKPTDIRKTDDAVLLTFPDQAGYVALQPLYGTAPQPRARMAEWDKALPEAVAAHARRWNAILKDIPVHCREAYAVDPVGDRVSFTQKFEYLTIRDEWGTKPKRLAPMPPLLSLVAQTGWGALTIDPKPVWLDYPTGTGPWGGVEDTDRFTYTLSGLLRYINRVEQPKALPDTEEARKVVGDLKVLRNFDRNYWTVRSVAEKGIDPILETFAYLSEAQKQEAMDVMRLHLAYLLNPRNLWFQYDPEAGQSYVLDGINSRRMGWTDGNAWSSGFVRALGRYATATGDVDFIRRRWETVKALYNVPARQYARWATTGFYAGGGDTFDDLVNGSIQFARLSAYVGDADSYRLGAAYGVRQMLALRGTLGCMPAYVEKNNLVGNLQRMTRGKDGKFAIYAGGVGATPVYDFGDFYFTDWRGGNVGFANWVLAGLCRSSEPEQRFLYDHVRDYAIYILDTLPRRNCPEWHRAVYVTGEKIPANLVHARTGRPIAGYTGYTNDVRNQLIERHEVRARFLGVPPEKLQDEMREFFRNNLRSGSALKVVLAGQPRQYRSAWEMAGSRPPEASDRIWNANAFVRPGGNLVMNVQQQAYDWPRMGWNGGQDLKTGRHLQFGSITPDPGKLAFMQGELELEAGLVIKASDFLDKPVLAQADALADLPVPHRSAILDHGLEDVDRYLRLFKEQGALEWLVIGPFASRTTDEFPYVKPPAVDPSLTIATEGYAYGDRAKPRRAVRWRPRKAQAYRLYFTGMFGPIIREDARLGSTHAFAAIHVRSPETRAVRFVLGSDDGYTLWLNGKRIARHQIYRSSTIDEENIPAVLRKGWNQIIVHVDNKGFGGGWELFFRIADENRLPFDDLMYSAAPPETK